MHRTAIVSTSLRPSAALCVVLALSTLANSTPAPAQQATPTASAPPAAAQKPLMLVTPTGPGAVQLPNGPDWKPKSLALYDNGTRPAAQLQKGDITVSYLIFQRSGGDPTPQGCRSDVIDPLTKDPKLQISQRVDGEIQSRSGQTLATTTYLLNMDPNHTANPDPKAPGYFQRSSFAFAANAHTCAELHLSSIHDTRDANQALNDLLSTFEPQLTYQPTATDYFRLGNQFFHITPASAVPYYRADLILIPNTPAALASRRVVTDQLVMSLGISRDLKGSRDAAQLAIAADPDYPMNYYNLACSDAELGDAASAKAHLQQAFDRRTNTLPNEHLPDPTKDESILKLKKDKTFWTFVESLPKS